jgi:hypothetical protein
MEERVMLNKKLVLGSLAGATLLAGAMILAPSAVLASGVVSGVCTGCHTMHNSVDNAIPTGGSTLPQGYLLLQAGCVGCHTGSANNTATGLGTGTPAAPQVGVLAVGTANAGGYFNTAEGATSHSVTDLTFAGTAALATAPGGGAMAITCVSCHQQAAGGHHTAGNGYRMLTAASTTTGPANYGQTSTVATYDSASMNTFCASCHGGFHGAGGQGAATPFIRHPTDNVSTAANSFNLPTGAANEVMCLSCHMAHGNARTDMIRFNYAANLAGDATASPGCETCHTAK